MTQEVIKLTKADEVKKYGVEIGFIEYYNLFQVVKASEKEVAFIFEVDKTEEIKNDIRYITYRLGRFIMPKQKMSAAHIEIDGDSEASQLFELEKGGMDIDKMKCMIHSHVNMQAFFSGTDKEEFTRLWNASETFYLSIVVNKREEWFICIADKVEDEMVKLNEISKVLPRGCISKDVALKMIEEASIEPPVTYGYHSSREDLFGGMYADYNYGYSREYNDYNQKKQKSVLEMDYEEESVDDDLYTEYLLLYRDHTPKTQKVLDEIESLILDGTNTSYENLLNIVSKSPKQIEKTYTELLNLLEDPK